MYLKRLELSGFKSFARPTVLDFTTPVTAIVGPNGSGKSNIAEAILFVLGEQSIKSLRGKRAEDLIFHGTKTIARLNRASVAIVFDNSKKVFDLDYDEVELKRVVYRDSTSEYFINGSKARLKDIIEQLSSVHIGASGHHIISQGEADRVLLTSIKERRSIVEDALGLKIYQYKRAERQVGLLPVYLTFVVLYYFLFFKFLQNVEHAGSAEVQPLSNIPYRELFSGISN